jgi:hemerythrin superfamily protein
MATSTKLEDLSADELRERAKKHGINHTSHMKKKELIEALSGDGGATDTTQVESRTSNGYAQDILALLKADHQQVKRLFKDVLERDDDDPQRGEIADQIAHALEIHAQAEEATLYTALKDAAVSQGEDDAREGVVEAYVEQDGVKDLIAKLRATDPSDEKFRAILQVMSEQVAHHVEEEEGDLFREARRLLRDRLAELGEAFAAGKAQAERR